MRRWCRSPPEAWSRGGYLLIFILLALILAAFLVALVGTDLDLSLPTVAPAQASQPAPRPLLEAGGGGDPAKQELWHLGVQLFGASQLEALVQESRRYPFVDGLVLVGPEGDRGVPTVIAEMQKDMYGIRELEMDPRQVYIDIGGHLGAPVLMAAKLYNRSRIVCVEASPLNYFYIRWNLVENGLAGAVGDRVIVLNRAVSSASGGTLRVFSFPRATTSSGSFKDERSFPGAAVSIVTTISLSDVLKQYGAGRRVALFKLDCEGCEWAAIPTLPRKDFKALFSGIVVGELHFAELSRDAAFANRTCGEAAARIPAAVGEAGHGQSHVCCATLSRLCPFSAFARSCPGVRIALRRSLGLDCEIPVGSASQLGLVSR